MIITRLLAIILFINSYLIIPGVGLYKDVGLIPLTVNPDTGGYRYDTGDLGYGVARLQGSRWQSDYEAQYGHPGRTILVGHSWGAFEYLQNVQVGDTIYLLPDYTTQNQTWMVTSKEVVWKTETDLLNEATGTYELVLMTCDAPGQRLLIRAVCQSGCN
jgi:LPXTG-site transpeptidase (sortase) family protein